MISVICCNVDSETRATTSCFASRLELVDVEGMFGVGCRNRVDIRAFRSIEGE
jgi:hypothetical protein